MLTQLNFNKNFYIHCDASVVGFGTVLYQEKKTEGEYPFDHFSKKLTPSQKNYSVIDRESLAVVTDSVLTYKISINEDHT